MAAAQLTVNLGALQRNWSGLNTLTGPSTEVAAVVKADAYGLGAPKVVAALLDAGATTFFVAAAEEGIEVRRAAPSSTIYVFSGFMQTDAALYAENELIPLLNSPAQLQGWQTDMGSKTYGMQLDTGMNRLGFEPDEFASVHAQAAKSSLLISHLACADEPEHALNQQQLACFHTMTDAVAREAGIPRSLAATGGTLLGSDFHFDMVRPGIGLYGGLPYSAAEPVVTLSLPVIQTREVQAGESVGYGAAWRAVAPTRVATLAAGYADGVIRQLGNRQLDNRQPVNANRENSGLLSNSVQLYVNDTACPMIGRVSMDMITVDITSLEKDPLSMELLNKQQSVDLLATNADTIGYEILTAVGSRYQREYVFS